MHLHALGLALFVATAAAGAKIVFMDADHNPLRTYDDIEDGDGWERPDEAVWADGEDFEDEEVRAEFRTAAGVLIEPGGRTQFLEGPVMIRGAYHVDIVDG